MSNMTSSFHNIDDTMNQPSQEGDGVASKQETAQTAEGGSAASASEHPNMYDPQIMKHLYENLQTKYNGNDPRRSIGRLNSNGQSMNWNIPSPIGMMYHVTKFHGTDSWRYDVLEFLHQPYIQKILMILLFTDVILLFTEFFLLAQYPHCTVIIRDGISCCPIVVDEAVRWLSEGATEGGGGDEHHSNVCDSGEANYNYPAGCNEHKWNGVHITETVIFSLTMCILFTFFIELNVTMIALKPSIFFKQFFYTLDYCVITISIVLELTFYMYEDDAYQSLAGFLVAVRLWRFVRIGHGVVELTHNMAHHEYEELLTYTEELEHILNQHHIVIPVRPEGVLHHADESSQHKLKKETEIDDTH